MPDRVWDWREIVSLVADVIGVLALIASVGAWRAVGELRRQVLSKARLPKHKTALGQYASDLSPLLGDQTANRAGINDSLTR